MRRLLALLLVVACHGPKDDDVVDTEVRDTEAVDTVVVDTDTDVPADTDTDVADTQVDDTEIVATTCKEAGGVCTSSALCGGKPVLAAFAADCVFDDGPGVCCEAPATKPTGNGCAARGGVCAPIAGCGFVDGWVWIDQGCNRQGGVGTVCCIPESACGPPTSECCNDDHSTSFVTTCDRGTETCSQLPGTTMVPLGTCLHTGTP